MLFRKGLLSKMAWGMCSITELFLMKRYIRESKRKTETPVFQILPVLLLVSWRQEQSHKDEQVLNGQNCGRRIQGFYMSTATAEPRTLHNIMYISLACVPRATDLQTVTTALSF